MVESKQGRKKSLSEEAIKQMFLDMFFWVAENRTSWLEEAIARRKKELSETVSETGE